MQDDSQKKRKVSYLHKQKIYINSFNPIRHASKSETCMTVDFFLENYGGAQCHLEVLSLD